MGQKLRNFIFRYWCFFFRHTRKNSHIVFFIKGFIRENMPTWILRKRLRGKLNRFYHLPIEEQKYIKERIDYYCKFKNEIMLPQDAPRLQEFTYKKRQSYVHDYVNSTYFYDAYEYTRYFSPSLRWAYNPGDINYLFPVPEITKSRPLTAGDENRNNILLNLDKVRHFTWIDDPFTWEEKECRIIFRGDTFHKPNREAFIKMWKDHPWCDLVSTSDPTYTQDPMPLFHHLRYRYIMSLEGNDVASNLKWVMSSNSIAVMPRPTCETWFMEGKLIPNYHYIEIADDFHDLIDKITYYESHPYETEAIVRHAHEWVAQFQNKKRENLISLMVLDKYFRLTGQKKAFEVPEVKAREKRRFFINEVVKLANYEQVNAQGKARKDVLQTFMDLGYERQDIINYKYSWGVGRRFHHYPYISHRLAVYQVKKFVRNVRFGDLLVIQDFYRKHMQVLAKEARKRGAKVVFVVHDVQTIRYNVGGKEIRKLNNSDLLLVHTQAMADKLKQLGTIVPMRLLWLFDYYSNDPMQTIDVTMSHKRDVIFAGNLSKSAFLKELIASDSNPDVVFRLYGMPDKTLDLSQNRQVEYAGMFQPEETKQICGGWGLVWDGDSIDSCTGDYGEYLRYNSSHKTSLYLTSGIPLIVWEESSLAEWVKKNGVGFTVGSLRDISKKINSLSDAEVTSYITNALAIGAKLREGYFMKKTLLPKPTD